MPERSAGVLLHISSLPSAYGIGDLGPAARSFAVTLAAAGIRYWQFLPLNPTSSFIGNSPYSSASAFAGNPLFISPELLCEGGYLPRAEVERALPGPSTGGKAGPVDYATVAESRAVLLNAAFDSHFPQLGEDVAFESFCHAHAYWLEDYALFSAIKEREGGRSWVEWPKELKDREPEALDDWAGRHARRILRHKFIQFIFHSQWESLRELCKSCGVRLIGDLPIYVTHDSADVWANRALFKLDAEGMPLSVSGVPPDYFSETGQRWGNPVYDWGRMAEDGFAWWKKRVAHNLVLADLVRLDHFRGFCASWEIPAEEETAVNGKWSAGPGKDFFRELQREFGQELPLVAEDLGVITDDVREAMQEFNLPGMKVLHFAFGGPEPWNNPDAPFRHTPHTVVYTGTHDNNTSRGWFEDAPEEELNNFRDYAGRELDADEAAETMIRLALGSVSELAVIPMQDIMNLGAEARMNTPSVKDGNWRWRMPDTAGWAEEGPEFNNCAVAACGLPLPEIFSRFHYLCRVYGRTDLKKQW